ncbi:hypothetical protein DITRI_Ditri18aG0124100 [Diplodiscus trichospermus]
MPDSKDSSASSPKSPTDANLVNSKRRSWLAVLFLSAMLPVVAAMVVYHLDSFDTAPMPLHELSQPPQCALLRNDRMLQGAELVGVGKFQGPEDILYDPRSEIIYTGSGDGWIKRVWLNESASDTVVENWVMTGGRPLGLAFGLENEVIVADAYKLTDDVDVAKDGMIYFTDASHKYSLHEFIWDTLEGRPYGRLLSFDPVSKRTRVLLSDLYFANGIAVSPDQHYLVFCETNMRRCRKYYIQGIKEGQVENFIDNSPGFPDNIRYDGEGHYWIALVREYTMFWDIAFRYPSVRKALAIIERLIGGVNMVKNSGVLAVDMDGKPVAQN